MSLLAVKDCFCSSGFDGQGGQTVGSWMHLPLDSGRFEALCNPTITLQFPARMANLRLKADGLKFLSLSDDVWGCAACALFFPFENGRVVLQQSKTHNDYLLDQI